MVHYVFWRASQPASQPGGGGGRGGGFQSLPATQPRLGAAPVGLKRADFRPVWVPNRHREPNQHLTKFSFAASTMCVVRSQQ